MRQQAVLLRRQGKSLRQIKQILGPVSSATLHDARRGEPPADWTRIGVAKSSVSLWVRDLPRPARLSYAERRKRSAEGVRRYRPPSAASARLSARPTGKPPPPRSATCPIASS